MKLVINSCYGGYSLSREGTDAYAAKKGLRLTWFRHEGPRFEKKVPADPSDDSFRATPYTSPDGDSETFFEIRPENRADPDLVAVVEELGEDADGPCAKLKVVEIPDGIEWEIEEYDGIEWVSERHRKWS